MTESRSRQVLFAVLASSTAVAAWGLLALGLGWQQAPFATLQKAADVATVTAVLLVLPSLISFGPIFSVPPALLAADGARRLKRR